MIYVKIDWINLEYYSGTVINLNLYYLCES